MAAKATIQQALLACSKDLQEQIEESGAPIEYSKLKYNEVGALKIANHYVPLPTVLMGRDTTKEVIELVVNVWITAAVHLGEDDARELFYRLAGRKRGERGPGQVAKMGRVFELYRAYEKYVRENPTDGAACRRVAEIMNERTPGKYGATVAAIEKQIRQEKRRRGSGDKK